MKTFTFKVNSVKTFESDTAGDLFSWLRLLQPGTINELKMVKIGKIPTCFRLIDICIMCVPPVVTLSCSQ